MPAMRWIGRHETSSAGRHETSSAGRHEQVQPGPKGMTDMTSKTQSSEGAMAEYVTAVIGGQLFGLPISRVQDVFMPERLSRGSLSSAGKAGGFNLRRRE